MADLLASTIPVPAADLAPLREEAEKRYDLPRLRRRTQSLADAYISEADAAIRAFEEQPGRRIEVQLPAVGTSRSRSSSAKRWVVDNGNRVFCSDFIAYTLRRPSNQVAMSVERRAVLDDLVPPAERHVAFFVPSVDSITVDGAPLTSASVGDYRFEVLRARGTGFSLDVRAPGTLTMSAGRVVVRLTERP